MTGGHERYARYLLEFANVADDDEPALVRAVLTDPDRVMAEAAVVHHLDLRAAALLIDPGFPAWTARMGALVADHPFPARRLREWACAEPAALAVLAERGRTRRVRAAALRAEESV